MSADDPQIVVTGVRLQVRETATATTAAVPSELMRLHDLLKRISRNAWFAYATIVLLQMKIIWGIWSRRDLTVQDTSYFFAAAYQWFHNGTVSIVWSPLFISFYGSMLYATSDAYSATILLRIVIVIVAAVLFLALMRRLLPSPLAWLITAWWVILPINFDTFYEVHLFAVLPLLAAYVLIVYLPGPGGRGAALGILLASSLLVRNEHILAAGVFAVMVLVYEVRRARTHPRADARTHYVVSYGCPVLLACLLTAFFYARASDKAPLMFETMRLKHELNICQVFAFSYQQRHPEWRHSPWTECQSLMQATFGKPELSLTEAIWHNPGAVMAHFAWNASLIPNGMQVLLLNRTSGNVNPDFAPVHSGSRRALVESMFLGGVYIWGLYKIYRRSKYWWGEWIKERAWGWLALVSPIGMALLIMLTERPRPEYLYTVSVLMMAVAGMCIYAIVGEWRLYKWSEIAFPVIVLLLIGFMPPFYGENPRPLETAYETLKPFAQIIRAPGVVVLTPGMDTELHHYLGAEASKFLSYWALRLEKKTDADWLPLLYKHGVTFFYVDENVYADPERPTFLSDPESYGWNRIAFQSAAGRRWMMLQRRAP